MAIELDGKTFLVTGANTGLGLATATELARRNGHVILLCRNSDRGLKALRKIEEETDNGGLEFVLIDLSSLESVRHAAHEIQDRHDQIDVLINNAGITTTERRTSLEGFELMLAVNVLGPLLLTLELLPLLERSDAGRVVNLTGTFYKRGKVDLSDLHFQRRRFTTMAAACQSQTARAMVTRELDRRFNDQPVTFNAIHPGAVLTEAHKHAPWYYRVLIRTILRPGFTTPKRSCKHIVRLATSPELEHVSGHFFNKSRQETFRGQAANLDRCSKFYDRALELVNF